ncbi:hypothetical protein [Candidatus Nanohalococcus occultus]|uniref:Uncharacterized protein n=1 Tax=Candidatus Nanohalococcus occultus TaxID=2978047 RepID=A0ABY8CD93_9ARCH|nr:hypothetical protein SVXNc_0160 [Candidatus Nanohaloarchaeota archaeon SVXNc]
MSVSQSYDAESVQELEVYSENSFDYKDLRDLSKRYAQKADNPLEVERHRRELNKWTNTRIAYAERNISGYRQTEEDIGELLEFVDRKLEDGLRKKKKAFLKISKRLEEAEN